MGLLDQFFESLWLILNSQEVWTIALLSIIVSLSAVLLSSLVGLPIGVYLGMNSDDNPRLLPASLLNTGMALPPVFVGLVLYLMLVRTGPLGALEILFTPLAMILAQFVLTLPIVIGVTRSSILELPDNIVETLQSLGATRTQQHLEIIKEARPGMTIAVIVALGRAFSEVGAIFIVGGNIRFHTRVLTTAIITEVSRGAQAMALALGILLISISFLLTTVLTMLQLQKNK